MGYAVGFAAEAEEDLEALIDSLPLARQKLALNAVAEALERLAMDPVNAPRLTHDRPTWVVNFDVDGVFYSWGATYFYSQNEQTVVVTHLFRLLF